MAFSMPNNAIQIGLQIMNAAITAMTEAEGAFSGHGTGEKKKAFVMARARELIATQDLINVDMMTKPQEDAALVTFDKGVEFVFSAWETAKLFKSATPPTV